MNENPEGAVNPTSQGAGTPPEAAQPAGVEQPVQPGLTTQSNTIEQPIPAEQPVQPVGQPAQPETQSPEAIPASGRDSITITQGNLAANQPAPAQPQEKKKTGLIVGLIIAAVLLIGGGIAAALLLMNSKSTDAVADAITRLLGEGKPNYVTVDGSIVITPDETEGQEITSLSLDLKSSLQPSSLINSTTATLTAVTKYYGNMTFDLGEVYAANGDLYININGISDLLENQLKPAIVEDEEEIDETEEELEEEEEDGLVVDCVDSEEMTDCTPEPIDTSPIFLTILSMLEPIDGEWIRIPLDSLNETGTSISGESNCMTEALTSFVENGNKLVQVYNNNAFISGTTENVRINSKANPVYRVVINKEKLADFASAAKTAGIKDMTKCVSVEETDINLPTIYVEVNDAKQFTRLYTTFSNDNVAVEADLSFGYPTNINVSEPDEYKEFEDVVKELFSSSIDY